MRLTHRAAERADVSSWRSLLGSFVQLSVGELVARMAGLVALVALTRRLGPAAFGVVTLGTSLVLWLKLVVDSGTETLNIRDISRQPHRFAEIAGAVLGLRLALSVLAIALFVPVPLLVVEDTRMRVTLALFALALPAVAINLRFMVLGLREARSVAIGNIAGQALFAASVLALVEGPKDSYAVPLLFAAGELVYGVVVIAFVARRFGLPRPNVDLAAWRRTLRAGLPLLVNQLSRALVFTFDLFAIAVVLGSYWAGVYGAAYKPVLFVGTLMALLTGSFLASYSAASPAHARQLFQRVTRLAVPLSVLLALAVTLGGGTLLELAFGERYEAGAAALSILIWFVPFALVAAIYATVMIANDRQVLLMRHNVAAAAFNIAANLLVLTRTGIAGPAAVLVLSNASLAFLNYRSCIRLGLAPAAGELLPETIARRRRRETVVQPPGS